MTDPAAALRSQILDLVAEYHSAQFPVQPFIAGQSSVPVSGRVFDAKDIQSLVGSSLDFWLTSGPYGEAFEKQFAPLFKARFAMLVNSGSSANLVAVSSLCSPLLKDRRLLPGDEVITVAAGFPTTVNPIIQNGLIPVFVDVDIPTYNIDVTQLEQALSPRTRAIVIAHTLGNPFDLAAVVKFAKDHDLFLVEDCCDAVGAAYDSKPVGSFGDFATTSFYPAHHITMGEGGCVLTRNARLKQIALSIRDWGRDCWCDPGKDNTCGIRFEHQKGDLPYGFDHKYTYSHIGYNLKVTDMQAAVGLSQLQKLEQFKSDRQRNFDLLKKGLSDLQEFLILPEATKNSSPSWFGFPIAVKPEAPFDRPALVQFLTDHKIATRLLFGGNLIRQPAYKDVRYRTIGTLEKSDFVMNNVFWVGVFPGLTPEMIDYMVSVFHKSISPKAGIVS